MVRKNTKKKALVVEQKMKFDDLGVFTAKEYFLMGVCFLVIAAASYYVVDLL